jgi:uncharacterized protein YdeI (YjbR/CyaY-like superfamily)
VAARGQRDPRVDARIARAPAFARPILEHLRDVVHAGCPEVVETLKWGRPAFEHHGLLAGMSAFTAHVVFGFWKHRLVVGDDERAARAMGSFGRITALSDLPSRTTLVRLVRKAAQLNEAGVSGPREKRGPRPPIPMHPELRRALARSKAARATFDGLSPSQRRDYLEWIAEAKRDETRERRVATAVEWLSQGKTRNWKYERR